MLIVVGEEDVATIPAKAERIHSQIKNSQLIKIPAAGHTSSIENPEAMNKVITAFLSAQKQVLDSTINS